MNESQKANIKQALNQAMNTLESLASTQNSVMIDTIARQKKTIARLEAATTFQDKTTTDLIKAVSQRNQNQLHTLLRLGTRLRAIARTKPGEYISTREKAMDIIENRLVTQAKEIRGTLQTEIVESELQAIRDTITRIFEEGPLTDTNLSGTPLKDLITDLGDRAAKQYDTIAKYQESQAILKDHALLVDSKIQDMVMSYGFENGSALKVLNTVDDKLREQGKTILRLRDTLAAWEKRHD